MSKAWGVAQWCANFLTRTVCAHDLNMMGVTALCHLLLHGGVNDQRMGSGIVGCHYPSKYGTLFVVTSDMTGGTAMCHLL